MLRRFRDSLRERLEGNLARRGIAYPFWVPLTCFVGQVTCVVVALAVRDALWPAQWLTLALVLVVASPAAHFLFGVWLPWWLDTLGATVAATWLMFVPVDDGVIDLAPALLALVAAESVARDGMRRGAVVTLTGAALLVLAAVRTDLNSPGIYLLEVLLGYVVGAMLWWQMRALAAEREARARAWEQATTAERERIAREIHDLVAHSLSVSLLQVTGARHALRDVDDAADRAGLEAAVAEVDAALGDAEQVGRRAMADIRRTVSGLADGAAERHPLPGAGDIAALVREMADAGLAIDYDEQGDPARLPDAAGLGLYRIAQESLANVAKHGAGSARVRLRVSGTSARLLVTNPLPAGRTRTDGLGSGLAGMQARAAQLGANLVAGPADPTGTSGPGWVVDVRLGEAPAPRREPWSVLPCARPAGTVEPA